jgi:phosphonate transport system substrate-binding protein
MNINSTNNIKFIKKVNYCLLLFFVIILSCISCQKNVDNKIVKVDFSGEEELYSLPGGSGLSLNAAVAAMVSPEENFFHYNDIFDYVSSKLGKKILFKQRKSYREVNELLNHQELDFAFICSGAYIEAEKDFDAEILAIPQMKGKTEYYAYIIVRKDSNFKRFEDLKGQSFAFTDPLSNTGCLYPKYLMKKMDESEEKFFSRIIYTYAHDYSIQAVESKLVDGASVDSLIFDYIQKNSPQNMANLKIIKKSKPFGMPPVVVHPKLDSNLKRELQSILLNMSTDSQGKEVLSHLGIERFVLGKDKDYDSIRNMKNFVQE